MLLQSLLQLSHRTMGSSLKAKGSQPAHVTVWQSASVTCVLDLGSESP